MKTERKRNPKEEESLVNLNKFMSYRTIETRSGMIVPFCDYNFSDLVLEKADLDSPSFQRLADNYGQQLLVPLFQESFPYSMLNKKTGNKPRFDQDTAFQEVAEYLGAQGNLRDKIFLLLDSSSTTKPFEQLIGYAIGYGLRDNSLRQLFEKTFIPGSLGTKSSDRFEMDLKFEDLENLGKTAYFNGLGIAKGYQCCRLGLLLTYEFFLECQKKGYENCLTRIVRGAGNWSTFAGSDDGYRQPLGNSQCIARYFNPEFNISTYYRGLFLTDVRKITYDLEKVLSTKIKVG